MGSDYCMDVKSWSWGSSTVVCSEVRNMHYVESLCCRDHVVIVSEPTFIRKHNMKCIEKQLCGKLSNHATEKW